MSQQSARAILSKEIKELLGSSAPIEFQDSVMRDLMAVGESRGKTNAQVIADRVIDLARQGDKWAVDFIAERTEGKAAQAVMDTGEARQTEEALNDVTVRHLNDLASASSAGRLGPDPLALAEDRGGDGDADHGADRRSAGPAFGLLDLPEDGDLGPEDDDGKP